MTGAIHAETAADPLVGSGTLLHAGGAEPIPSLEEAQRVEVSTDQLEDQNIVGFRNADTRARAFKLLRTQIVRRREEMGLKLIGITSAAPNVGKTFVACNLAAALSRIAELDVYVIDLDLHRPSIAGRFSLDQDKGIHDYLSGEVSSLSAVARRINDERLVVVPGYRRPVATGELLTGVHGERLFAGLKALPSNAVVLIDMPPIFADDDAVIIGQHLDGYLLVVEDGKTTSKQARETVRLLSPTPMIGCVLNRFKNKLFTDEYGYGYSYGYGGYY